MGYIRTWKADHQVMEHRLIIEGLLKKTLPQKAVIHHINGDKSDNIPGVRGLGLKTIQKK